MNLKIPFFLAESYQPRKISPINNISNEQHMVYIVVAIFQTVKDLDIYVNIFIIFHPTKSTGTCINVML